MGNIFRVAAFAAVFVIGLLGLSTIFGSWYTIDQTERGVILRNGAVNGVADPGLGWKLPWIDSIRTISVQQHVQRYETLQAYSADQQPATMVVSVNYRVPVDQVENVYSNYRDLDGLTTRLLDPRVNEEVKTVFGQYTAQSAISNRAKLNADVAEAIQSKVNGPIIVDSVQIENIDYSDAYEKSVEERMLAEVEVQKLRQNAEREKVQAAITVTKANAAADAVRANAQAQADSVRLLGEAEATAIDAKGKAIRENPGLIELTKAEKWNGSLPTTMIPGSTIPFIDVAK